MSRVFVTGPADGLGLVAGRRWVSPVPGTAPAALAGL